MARKRSKSRVRRSSGAENLREHELQKPSDEGATEPAVKGGKDDRSSGRQLFMILSRSRTGSSLLAQVLNEHPDIVCYREIFGRVDNETWRPVLDRLVDPEGRYAWVGFKIFYNHPVGGGPAKAPSLWSKLQQVEAPIIHLRRRNVIRTIVSSIIAANTSAYSARKSLPVEERSVSISPDIMERQIAVHLRNEKWAESWLNGRSSVEIAYEDFVSNTEAELGKIWEVLGLSAAPWQMKMTKQNAEPLSDLLKNFDELVHHFRGTEFEKQLLE